MIQNPDYIAICTEIVQRIDPRELAALPVGSPIGRGKDFAMHTLGSVSLGADSLHVGLKLPRTGLDPIAVTNRLRSEMTSATILVDRAPSLLGKVPHFMGLVGVEETDTPIGLLTEDATKGGELVISPTSASSELLEVFETSFGIDEGGRRPYSDDDLETSAVFRVGDQERILDFTPSPLKLSIHQRRVHHLRIEEALPNLTVKVALDSPLGQSLPRP